jgi:hypothetical protein
MPAPSTSYSDVSSASSGAHLTQGAKYNGLNITASRETPAFLSGLFGAPAQAQASPSVLQILGLVSAVLSVGVLVYVVARRK